MPAFLLVLLSLTAGTRATQAPPSTVFSIDESGAFTYGDHRGTLDKPDLATLRAQIKRTTLALKPNPVRCDAVTSDFYTLVAGSTTFAWEEPCQPEPDDSVRALIRTTKALLDKRAPRPLVSWLESPLGQPDHETLLARIAADGTLSHPGGKRRLDADELTELTALIRQAKLKVRSSHPCDAVPSARYRIETRAGQIAWEEPCSTEPDPSVARLVARLRTASSRRR